jgi:hypothetical protein
MNEGRYMFRNPHYNSHFGLLPKLLLIGFLTAKREDLTKI